MLGVRERSMEKKGDLYKIFNNKEFLKKLEETKKTAMQVGCLRGWSNGSLNVRQ